MSSTLAWQRVSVDGRHASYCSAGDGDGLPVVFLHGWGLGHRSYRQTIARLVDLGCRVWAPALPGFGGTAGLPRRDFDLTGYADWVAAFLETIEVDEPVFLIGHSFGGGVAIATAHRHPDRVRSLVLVNSIGGAEWKGDRMMADRPFWDWGLHFPRDLIGRGVAQKVLPVVLQDAVPNLLRNPKAMWTAGQLARTADLTAELQELRQRQLPVVVLWGTQDGVIPRASFDALCRAIGTEGEVIDGSHSWLLADPDTFGEVMTNAVAVAKVARAEELRPRRVSRLRAWLSRKKLTPAA
jgi:pimeloyl-ACP methyl ester carboxylesterase